MIFTPRHVTPRPWHYAAIGLIVLAAIGFKAYGAYWPKKTLFVGGEKLTVLVADTPAHRHRGLGRRDSLGEFGGMLFVFPYPGRHSIVMRDMRFPIDIIWIDGDRVVDLAPDVPTEPGKNSGALKVYLPRTPATLVLETPAGLIERLGVKIGDKVVIN